MRHRFGFSPIFVLVICAIYVAGEWLSAWYYERTMEQRQAHNFHRLLIISGQQVGTFVSEQGNNTPSAVRADGLPTQFLSAGGRRWISARSFVDAVFVWSVQVWDLSIGGTRIPQVTIYGVDEESVLAFNLGNPDALLAGDLVPTASLAATLASENIRGARAVIDIPSIVLSQLPDELAEKVREQSMGVLRLADYAMSDPPALRPGRHVAYLHRYADQISGLVRASEVYVVLLRQGYPVQDAQAEIQSYLSQYEPPTSIGVEAATRSVDDYFPPLVGLTDLQRWMFMIRVSLVACLLVVGFAATWVRLRQDLFETALRRALGSTRTAAFWAVYGPWLGVSSVAMLIGATPIWLLGIVVGQLSFIPISVLTLMVSLSAFLIGTLVVAWRSLSREPLRELAGDR